ncbi:MAG TPA: acetoacetate--CoA ligase, partial [Hyphomicrobiaceae bacterium]|nr:acetoacetate--CoA ligase [Hyphomicrobiaceae bacterium]HEX6000611.1 acetoacetate--CoA ligase [Hyphomicrobiaceae bacterium]
MTEPLWTPDERRSSATTLSAFCTWLSSRIGTPIADYGALHRWSVADPAAFWSAVWDFSQVAGDKGEPPYLIDADKMPGAQF